MENSGTVQINFPVYETIWTGGVDKILGYDFDNHHVIVQDVKTGKVRTHMTSLDVFYLQKTTIPHDKISYVDRLRIARQLIKAGFPKRMINYR